MRITTRLTVLLIVANIAALALAGMNDGGYW